MKIGQWAGRVTTEALPIQDRRVTFKRTQDIEDILERNKRLRSMPQKSDWGRHYASIPAIFYERWLHEEHAKGNTKLRLFSPEFDQIVKRKLQDPDYRAFRVDDPANPFHMGFGKGQKRKVFKLKDRARDTAIKLFG